jgi:outer membrane biosynthesis protein TonB
VIHYGEPLILIGKKPEPTPAPPPAEAGATNSATAEQKPAAPEPAAAPKVVPDEKPNPATVATTSAESTLPAASAPETWVKTTAPPAQPGVESGAAVPSQSLFSARNVAIVSVAFAALVCGLLILTARQARRQSQASLITRSLDREK